MMIEIVEGYNNLDNEDKNYDLNYYDSKIYEEKKMQIGFAIPFQTEKI